MISCSLEWTPLELSLRRRIKNLSYKKDVSKMIENIDREIKKLSIAEISARRGRRAMAEEILNKINHDIELVEEYILVATLLG